jgi:glycosyltransferase involved in cell wall biosynthesis
MAARAARAADAVVVPTRAVADELAQRVSGPAPVHVIPHGVAEALAAPSAAAAPELPSLPERFVLAVGTLEPRKGIDVLVRAMAGVEGASLVLVGQPGWGGVDAAALAREHGLPESRLCQLGRLPDTALAEVLRRAAALAAPSLAEGFGLPVLEAMAAGTPVVHSDAPALLEVAGGAGVAVPRGDAAALAARLGEVLGSPDRAARMAEAGRRRAAGFCWRRAAEAVWALHTAG